MSNIPVSSEKDINDLDGIHCYWRSFAAVALFVHDNHEEVAAGNLLYDKRSAAHTEREFKYFNVCNVRRLNTNHLTWIDNYRGNI